jgi:hypothetical protein
MANKINFSIFNKHDNIMKTLATWKRGDIYFKYIGSVQEGTTIYYGTKNPPKNISAEQYRLLLNYFQGKTVKMGPSKDNPPVGSLGEWLKANVCNTAIASYVSAILIDEGYAEKNKAEIIFYPITVLQD